ncbi:discoidin domain-containing protein [Bacteroides sedimenti]
MKIQLKYRVLSLTTLFCLILGANAQNSMSLAGKWEFKLDPMDMVKIARFTDPMNDFVLLPGTTDSNQKGIKNPCTHYSRLSRNYEYCGLAWYKKEVIVPEEWHQKTIELSLERVLWKSCIYIDGVYLSAYESFSTPHTYNLSNVLTPGKHTITLGVDNRIPVGFNRWCHAYTDFTQTDWNGVIGHMELKAYDQIRIKNLEVYPNVTNKTAKVVCEVYNVTCKNFNGNIVFNAKVRNSGKNHAIKQFTLPVSGNDSIVTATTIIPMGDKVQLWDEFTPALYKLTAGLSAKTADGKLYSDTKEVTFGMREMGYNVHHVTVNGHPVFLRGLVENAVFPITAHPDMTYDGWLRICKIIKSYGFNHIRFHSWCPPEAAFEAADEIGIYLQPELPAAVVVGKDPAIEQIVKEEQNRILKAYGNHPSFALFAVGNELKGDFSYIEALVKHGVETDKRRLYTGSTARAHVDSEQFYESHVSPVGTITTYGAKGPQTDYDLRVAYDGLKVPGIAHEVGQRCVYPNFDEMKKYTGVLSPRNFQIFKDTLTAHGMLDQAKDFFNASGQMTNFLYKESIEALLRTPNCGGFSLLGLNDYPGQGTAFVGILDPFWDSKGITTSERFSESCSQTVPLLLMKKRTYFGDETFNANAEIHHFGANALRNLKTSWDIKTLSDETIASGKFNITNVPVATVASLGTISVPLNTIKVQQKLIVTIYAGTGVKNSWEIWVYPRLKEEAASNKFIVSKTLDKETIAVLENGGNVLLLPDVKQLNGYGSEFQNMFWSPIMFQWEPMSMGTLVKDKHPIFKEFATEYYTNWQWWEIVSGSKVLNLEGTSNDFRPLVQVIDNYARCKKQGILFEAKVGKGKLIMTSIDFEKDKDKLPASQQLLYSIKKYMASEDFNPKSTISVSFLEKMFKKPSIMIGAKVLSTSSNERGSEGDKTIDGDLRSSWNSSYGDPKNMMQTNRQEVADYPHEIQIELNGISDFKGFVYYPDRADDKGRILEYAFYISADGKNWGTPIAKGFFKRGGEPQSIVFDKVQRSQYIRLVGLSGFDRSTRACVTELTLIPSN